MYTRRKLCAKHLIQGKCMLYLYLWLLVSGAGIASTINVAVFWSQCMEQESHHMRLLVTRCMFWGRHLSRTHTHSHKLTRPTPFKRVLVNYGRHVLKALPSHQVPNEHHVEHCRPSNDIQAGFLVELATTKKIHTIHSQSAQGRPTMRFMWRGSTALDLLINDPNGYLDSDGFTVRNGLIVFAKTN